MKGQHIVKPFKGCGLYNFGKSVVEQRNTITKRDTGDVTQLSTSFAAENLPGQASTSMGFLVCHFFSVHRSEICHPSRKFELTPS